MTTARTIKMAFAATAIVAIAGCQAMPQQVSRPSPAPQQPAPQNGIEGNWIDEQGTGQTIFGNGSFRTVATDTGQTLSQGNYSMRDGSVQISGQSLIRDAPIRFNCSMANPSQLNCTSENNQRFVLRRDSGTASM